MMYEKPNMEVMYFNETIRTDAISASSGLIEPGDNNVDAIYPW